MIDSGQLPGDRPSKHPQHLTTRHTRRHRDVQMSLFEPLARADAHAFELIGIVADEYERVYG